MKSVKFFVFFSSTGKLVNFSCDMNAKFSFDYFMIYIYIIVTDMEGNIRIYRLPKDPYHDPICLS